MVDNSTERVLEQGKALVRAIEALETIDPTGQFESFITDLLVAAYRQRLRSIVETAPIWMSEEILGASKRNEERKPAKLISKN